MGRTYEVTAWKEVNRNDWQDVQVYVGDSLFAAICAMVKARHHSGCVRLHWRG